MARGYAYAEEERERYDVEEDGDASDDAGQTGDESQSSNRNDAQESGGDDQEQTRDRKSADDDRDVLRGDASDREQAVHTAVEEQGISDDDASTDRRFTSEPQRGIDFGYFRETPGMEHLSSSASVVESMMASDVRLADLVAQSSDQPFSIFGKGLGRSAQYAVAADTVDAFRTLAHQRQGVWSQEDLNTAAIGVADQILARYDINYEKIQAYSAYQGGNDSASPGIWDVTSRGEQHEMKMFHAQIAQALVNSTTDVQNGKAEYRATNSVLNSLNDLTDWMQDRGIIDARGELADGRLSRYETEQLRSENAAMHQDLRFQQQQGAGLREQLEFAMNNAALSRDITASTHVAVDELTQFLKKDSLSQFVAVYDRLDDNQRAAFSPGDIYRRVEEALNYYMPPDLERLSADPTGIESIRNAMMADYPSMFSEALSSGGAALEEVKARWDDAMDCLLTAQASDYIWQNGPQAFDAGQLQDQAEVGRFADFAARLPNRATDDPNFAAAMAALPNQASRDLVITLSTQASEHASDDWGENGIWNSMNAINAIFNSSNQESYEAWRRFTTENGYPQPELQAAYIDGEPVFHAGGDVVTESSDTGETSDAGFVTDNYASSDLVSREFVVPEEFKSYVEGFVSSETSEFPSIFGAGANAEEWSMIHGIIDMIPAADPDRDAAQYFFQQGKDVAGFVSYGMFSDGVDNELMQQDAEMCYHVVQNILGAREDTTEAWFNLPHNQFEIPVSSR